MDADCRCPRSTGGICLDRLDPDRARPRGQREERQMVVLDEALGATMTSQRLREFGDAWSRGDIEELMAFIAPDCIYQASVGPEPGETFRGKAEVRRGFIKLLKHDSDAVVRSGRVIISGNVGIAEWTLVRGACETRGCDLFEFEGNLIKRKDAFRKVFG